LAPEGPIDERSDLYSLGIIAYELLTGAAPFTGSTYQEVIVRHIRETPDLSKLPEAARPIVGWLLAKDPKARPPRASALLPFLWGGPVPIGAGSSEAAVPTRGPSTRITSAKGGPVRFPQLKGWLAAAICLVVIAAIVAASFAMTAGAGRSAAPSSKYPWRRRHGPCRAVLP
jgi:serine/threonine protein kinase